MPGSNTPLHLAPPLQLLSFVHGTHMPPPQTPLLQSVLTRHALPLLSRQKEDWQLPPAQSVFFSQRAPPGDLQLGMSQRFDLHWLFALQAVQTAFAHSPLTHKASSSHLLPVGRRHLLAKQMPLAQALLFPQGAPAATLQVPVPSQAFVPPQVRSGCPKGVSMQVPRDPGASQLLQVPLQAVSQQTLSAQLPLRQPVGPLHGSPLHPLQLPPQSMPVSLPFWTPSEQPMQLCVPGSQVSSIPAGQSLSLAQMTHAPAPSQTPVVPWHGMPAGIAR